MAKKSSASKRPAKGDPLTRQISRLERRMVDFAARFVSIATVNPPGRDYLECVQFLADKLRSLGMSARIVRVDGKTQEKVLPGSEGYPRYSVVGRWDVGARRTLHFTGHYDVVPPTSGWKQDPFRPVVQGRRLVGRGSDDMKTSITAAIFAVEAMMEAGVTPPWNIQMSFTPDEETGGELGLGYLVKTRQIAPDAAVLCEGASGPHLGYAHKGVLWLDVTVLGKPGHACYPPGGINALEQAAWLIDQFAPLKAAYAKRRTSFLMEKAGYKHPTLMIGGISGGGGKVNTIPDRFHFTIDRRINPEEKLADVKAELMGVIAKAQRRNRKLKTRVETLLHVPPGWADLKSDFVKNASAAFAAVMGKRPRYRMTPGFTDMHWLTQDAGVQTVLYGCQGGGAHGDYEYTMIPSMSKTCRVYAEIALRMPVD